jgi:hypothetical protein
MGNSKKPQNVMFFFNFSKKFRKSDDLLLRNPYQTCVGQLVPARGRKEAIFTSPYLKKNSCVSQNQVV